MREEGPSGERLEAAEFSEEFGGSYDSSEGQGLGQKRVGMYLLKCPDQSLGNRWSRSKPGI